MVKALESQGVTLSVSSGSPTSFSSIANVSKIHGPGDNAAVIDASNLDSVAREKMMGVPDEGQVTLDIFYDPDAATHLLLRSAMRSRTRMEFKITLTDAAGTTLLFGGYVIAFVINTALSDAIRGAVTIAVDGPSTDGDSTPETIVSKILLHFDGIDGATTTTDEYGNTVTITGAAASLSSSYALAGATSLKGDSGGPFNYATVTGIAADLLAQATGWTIELFAYYHSLAGNALNQTRIQVYTAIEAVGVDMAVSPNTGGSPADSITLYLARSGGTYIANAVTTQLGGAVALDVWHHIALVYDSAAQHYYSYFDGAMVHDIASADLIRDDLNKVRVIPSDFSGVSYLNYVDEFRLSQGCRYPGGVTFTPPTTPFTS